MNNIIQNKILFFIITVTIVTKKLTVADILIIKIQQILDMKLIIHIMIIMKEECTNLESMKMIDLAQII